MTFFVYYCVLLRFIKVRSSGSTFLLKLEAILADNFRFRLNLVGILCPFSGVFSVNNNSLDSFIYFSNNNNPDPENHEDSSNSNNNLNSSNNPENREDSESENNSDHGDIEKSDVREVDNHNAPEEVMNDLDRVDKARNNDPVALDELKGEYPAFFENNSDKDALKEIEDYLESEFPGELKRSEIEADELDGKGTTSNNSNNDDGNNSSGGSGPSAPSGPGPSGSDPGPSGSDSGGNLSKTFIILGAIFETISKVFEDAGNYM